MVEMFSALSSGLVQVLNWSTFSLMMIGIAVVIWYVSGGTLYAYGLGIVGLVFLLSSGAGMHRITLAPSGGYFVDVSGGGPVSLIERPPHDLCR